MLLSIVLPIYNVEKYIRSTLDSIFYQCVSEECFEVIVIDDETPDNSMQIVDEFAIQHHNMKIIHQKNKGLSGARNTGLKEAKGEYVWFVDSDDKLVDDALSLVFMTLNKHNDNDMFGFGIYTEDEETGNRHYLAPLGTWTKNKPYRNAIDYSVVGNHTLGPTARYIFKRDFLKRNELTFWEGKLHEDIEFLNKAFFYAKNIWLEKKPTYIYLERSSGSIMSTIKMKSFYDLLDICKSYEKIKEENIDNQKAILYWDAVMWRIVTIMQNKKIRGYGLADSDLQEYNQFIRTNKYYFRKLTFRGIKASIQTHAWKDTILGLRSLLPIN